MRNAGLEGKHINRWNGTQFIGWFALCFIVLAIGTVNCQHNKTAFLWRFKFERLHDMTITYLGLFVRFQSVVRPRVAVPSKLQPANTLRSI